METKEIKTSKGLHLVKNEDGKSYTAKGIGSFSGKELQIGVCEDGLPVTKIADCAFRSKQIEKLVLGESVREIGKKAFFWCDNLSSVETYGVEKIQWLAFSNCLKLQTLTLGEKITVIGECAFEECKKLSFVEIPKSVQEIGASAFYACPLERAVFRCVDGWVGENIPDLKSEKDAARRLSSANAYSLKRIAKDK